MGNICANEEKLQSEANSDENFKKRSVFEVSKEISKKSSLIPNSDKFSARKKLEISPEQKILMRKYWESIIMVQRKDIFHKTMLASIESSPKMNEIIACGRYCFRDLTQWPKLNRICQAQFQLFHHLVVEVNLDEEEITRESHRLGKMHSTYAQFGLKAHFLDIFQLHLLRYIEMLKIENVEEKIEMLAGWTAMMNYMIECMNFSYTQAVIENRNNNNNNNMGGVIEEL